MTQKLLIIGAGAVGLESAWVMESRGMKSLEGSSLELIGYADDKYKGDPSAKGQDRKWSIEAALEGLNPREVAFHCAIGNNAARETIAGRFLAKGFSAVTLAHSTAVVASSASVGRGSYLGAYVVVAPEAKIGEFCLLNTHAAVGHHSDVGDFNQISPGAKISGHCTLGKRVFVGSNAVLIPKAKVGDDAVVAASSLVLKSVAAGTTVIGIPAKSMAARPRTPNK
jgi:sugar O-acyltransferase (sialic acid O-acetyltransferase NeuD family)